MSKTVKTYNLDSEIAEKFAEQTPSRKTSQTLEKLMAEYLDEEVSTNNKAMFDLRDYTPTQKKALKFIIEENLVGKKLPSIKNKLNKKKGLYSRKDHFKSLAKKLTRSLPLSKSNNLKLIADNFECESCGESKVLTGLDKTDYSCVCGQKILKL